MAVSFLICLSHSRWPSARKGCRALTLFDRYLLKRFLSVFAICIAATFGLFVVFDAFTNADEFQDGESGTGTMLLRMAEHYFYQLFPFLDLIGPILVVIAAMGTFALLLRHSEIYPVLSAGVPTWRLAVPVVLGTVGVILLLTINQEVIIPRIAHRLQADRSVGQGSFQVMKPARDFMSSIEISGKRLSLATRRIENAQFLLPVPTIVAAPVTLQAEQAIQLPARGRRPAGWLLRKAQPSYSQLTAANSGLLTERGLSLVFATKDPDDLFVATDVTVDQLHNRTSSFRFLSTGELVQRIRNPAFGLVSIQLQTRHLHERLTRPFLILASVLVAIPLTIRRESRGLLLNMATACGVLGILYVLTQAAPYLGRFSMTSVEFAAWLPVMLSGVCAAWLADRVQT